MRVTGFPRVRGGSGGGGGFGAVATPAQLVRTSSFPAPTVTGGSGTVTKFWDDFSGAAGSALGSSTWTIDGVTSANNWAVANGVADYTSATNQYVSSTANVYMDGASHLVIATTAGTAGYVTNSGHIDTWGDNYGVGGGVRYGATWGSFSASIRCVPVTGYWPAFWTFGIGRAWPQGGEIDCLENFGGGYTNPLQRTSAGLIGGTDTGAGYRHLPGGSYTIPDAGYHTYTWVIPSDYSSLTFKIDGAIMSATVPNGRNPTITSDWVNYAENNSDAIVGSPLATWPFGPTYSYGLIFNVSTNAGGVTPVNPALTQTILKVDWAQVNQP